MYGKSKVEALEKVKVVERYLNGEISQRTAAKICYLESTEERLGADILIVSERSESDLEGVLLKGTPSTYYLDEATKKEVLRLFKLFHNSGKSIIISHISVTLWKWRTVSIR